MRGDRKDRKKKGEAVPQGGGSRHCRSILRNLYQLLEDSAGDEVCGEMRAHLEVCPDCAGQYEAIRRLAQICRQQPEATLPEETRQRIKKGLLEALAARTRGRTADPGHGT